MNKLFKYLSVWLVTVAAAQGAELATIFSDHMVLQQGMPVPVWGTGQTGETITVTFAGQEKSTKVDENGRWMLRLDALAASAKPDTLTLRSTGGEKTVSDVLVGEVWFCSGQSNMDMVLRRMAGKAMDEKDQPIADVLTARMNQTEDNLLRQFTVRKELSALKPLDHLDGTWITASSSENNGNFTAVGFFYGLELRAKLKVPVGLINCAWGGTQIEPWMPKEAFSGDPSLEKYYQERMKSLRPKLDKWDPAAAKKDYEAMLAAWKENGQKGPEPEKPTDPARSCPAGIYNGMVHPVVPYGMRGVIWYQGESNRYHYPELYAQHFEAMVNAWRAAWGQGDFPVYYVQLAAFGAKGRDPKTYSEGWPIIQDQQRRALRVKNTGMVVANDIGAESDIHPKNKIDVGKRLALLAMARSYGQAGEYSGPIYEKFEIRDGQVIIYFSHSGSGLMVGEKNLLEPVKEIKAPLGGFEIRGEGQDWMAAQAKIVGPSEVAVSHPDCPAPTAVRYAWSKFPEKANLYNREGLPASIFMTGEDSKVLNSQSARDLSVQSERDLKPVVFYLENLPLERIGELGDTAIITRLEEQGCLVIPVDCGSYPRTSPQLEEELIKFHERSPALLSQYYSESEIKSLDIFYVPEGYMLQRQIPVWNIKEHGADGSIERIMDTYNSEIVKKYGVAPVQHPDEMVDKYGNPLDYNLYLDIIYPSGKPDEKVPLALLFSASSSRQESLSPVRETPSLRHRNIFPLGFLTSGYAFAFADHCYNPLAREDVYGYFSRYSLDDWNGKASTTAYIRFLNQHADEYNLNGKYGVMGISKASFSAVRIADRLNAEGSEHSLFNGKTNTKPQPWQGFPSSVDVAYAAAGNGTRRIQQYVNKNMVPMVTSAGLTDKYGHWSVYPSVVRHFKDLDKIHLAFWMEDLGHDYPCFGTDLATGVDRYWLTKQFFDHFLKPPKASDPLKVFYVLPKENAPAVDSRGFSRILAADDILPEKMEGLSPFEPITVRFLSRVDPVRIRECVKVYGKNHREEIQGAWTSSMEGTTFHFEPLNDLVKNETYQLVIAAGLDNELGQVLSNEFVREFSVTEDPAAFRK